MHDWLTSSSRRNRFVHAKTHLLSAAPGAFVFVLIWLVLLGFMLRAWFTGDWGSILSLSFATTGIGVLAWGAIRKYRRALNDYRITKRQRKS